MEKFDEIYNKILNDSTSNNIENEQIEYRKSYLFNTKISVGLLVLGIASMIAIFAVLFLVHDLSDTVIMTLVISLFVIFILLFFGTIVQIEKANNPKSPYNTFTKNYKNKVITPLIKNYDSNLEYSQTKKISKELYNQSVVSGYTSFYSDDYISGNLNGQIPVVIGDVETEIDHDDSPDVTVFEGLFAAVELPKNFNNLMLITSDYESIRKPFSKEDQVQMDSLGFEKGFNVYSKNRMFAMSLLTSTVLDELLQLQKENSFEVCIKDNHMYIQLECENSFEINISKDKKAVDYDTLHTYYNNLDTICKLITYFYNLLLKTNF